MTLLVTLASYILASLHLHTFYVSHIYNNTIHLVYHLSWEFEKPFMYHPFHYVSLQLKITELMFLYHFCV